MKRTDAALHGAIVSARREVAAAETQLTAAQLRLLARRGLSPGSVRSLIVEAKARLAAARAALARLQNAANDP